MSVVDIEKSKMILVVCRRLVIVYLIMDIGIILEMRS